MLSHKYESGAELTKTLAKFDLWPIWEIGNWNLDISDKQIGRLDPILTSCNFSHSSIVLRSNQKWLCIEFFKRTKENDKQMIIWQVKVEFLSVYWSVHAIKITGPPMVLNLRHNDRSKRMTSVTAKWRSMSTADKHLKLPWDYTGWTGLNNQSDPWSTIKIQVRLFYRIACVQMAVCALYTYIRIL